MAVNLRVVLSDRCNYRCVFCSHDFNRAVNMDISPEFLAACIENYASLGGAKVTYTGGEPLRYPGLMNILRFTKSLGLTNAITTNGSLLHVQSDEFYSVVDALNPGYGFCVDCRITRDSSCPSCRSVWVYPDGRITLCPFNSTRSYLGENNVVISKHMKELMKYDRQEGNSRDVH